MAKAQELNYIKDEGARSLRMKKTSIIGVIVRDITNPFYSQFVKEIEDALYKRGYTIMICNTGYDLEKEKGHINVLLSRKVDGIILSPTQESNDNIIMIKKHNMPLILFDCKISGIDVDSILVDNETGAKEAVEYLISVGHKRIAYIGGNAFDSNNQLRFAGYEKALREASLPIREEYVKHGSYSFNHGYLAAKELLRLKKRPTAFFVVNNRIVLGAYNCILDCGLRIPENISIIGFDDFETATILPSPLTVIRQPLQEMVLNVVDLLLLRIEKMDISPYVTNMLKTELILRASTKDVA